VVAALAAAGCVAAEEEAADLVAAADGPDELEAMVARRVTGEPLAWITRTARFCGLDVVVRPGVYVPRWQSESLARSAAGLLHPTGTAVDLCTGSGAIALVLATARPGAHVVATELDPTAASCARENGVDVRVGDLDDALPAELVGTVDVMTGVLPYVPAGALHLLPRDVVDHEPRMALDGGPDGLAVVTRAVRAGTRWLAPGGWLLLEVGGGQVDPVRSLLVDAGYDSFRLLHDGDGDPRGIGGRRPVGPGPTSVGRAQASSR
jgi:release factor glutamine methyltransferase